MYIATHRSRLWAGIVIAIILGVFVGDCAGQVTRRDANGPTMQAILARMQKLENLDVAFDSTTTFYPVDPEKLKPYLDRVAPHGEMLEPRKGELVESNSFAHLNGQIRFEWDRKEAPPGEPIRIIWTRTANRSESLVFRHGDESVGVIGTQMEFNDTTIDLALGLRCYQENQWLNGDAWQRATEIHDIGSGRSTLLFKDAIGQVDNIWTVDSHFGYAPVLYEQNFKDGEKVIRVEASDFREVGGVMLPFKIDRTVFQFIKELGPIGSKTDSVTIKVKEYKVGDPTNLDANYMITWPSGTQILDQRTMQQMVVGGQDHKLDDATIVKGLEKQAQEKRRAMDAGQKRIDDILTNPATHPTTSSGGDR